MQIGRLRSSGDASIPNTLSQLEKDGVAISMDGRGRALDNVFVERLHQALSFRTPAEVYAEG